MILRRLAKTISSTSISAALLMNASCSEPTPSTPNSPPEAGPKPGEGNTNLQIMQLIPNLSDPALEDRGGALTLIFGQGMIDPFESNNSQQLLEMDFKARSERIDEQNYQNFVRGRFTIRLKRGSQIIATRDFESQGNILLQNVESQDIMTGVFKDMDSSSVTLSISARRNASNTAQSAAQNAWRGTLNLVEADSRETPLGTLSGFFSGLLTP